MSVEIIKVEDYERIAKENEFFFWNFVCDSCELLALQPYHTQVYGRRHLLKEFIDTVPINYYESKIEESIDFLIKIDPHNAKRLYSFQTKYFKPVIFAFHKRRFIDNTWNFCYCIEGFTDLILKTNPQLLENLELED